jgi:hypothetical protein
MNMKKRERGRGFMDYERMGDPLAPPEEFRRRFFTSGGIAAALLTLSLALGVCGYHWIAGVPRWVDCIQCASMIMGGMGPVDPQPTTDAGKLFASFYAIYSGVMLLASVGLLLAPGLHRILHRFHVPTDDE